MELRDKYVVGFVGYVVGFVGAGLLFTLGILYQNSKSLKNIEERLTRSQMLEPIAKDWSVSKSYAETNPNIVVITARTDRDVSPDYMAGYNLDHGSEFEAICLADRKQGGCFDGFAHCAIELEPLLKTRSFWLKTNHTTFTREQVKDSVALLEKLSEQK